MAHPDFNRIPAQQKGRPTEVERPLAMHRQSGADQNVRLIETAQVRGRPGLAVITPSGPCTSSTVL